MENGICAIATRHFFEAFPMGHGVSDPVGKSLACPAITHDHVLVILTVSLSDTVDH